MNIYNMKLHEEETALGMYIIRVPNGWIYKLWDYDNDCYHPPVFVPSSSETIKGVR